MSTLPQDDSLELTPDALVARLADDRKTFAANTDALHAALERDTDLLSRQAEKIDGDLKAFEEKAVADGDAALADFLGEKDEGEK